MTDLIPIKCEARLMGFKKESRADGEWTQLVFQIHPDDTPHALFLLPLKTHVMLSIKGAGEAQEQPSEAATERPKGGPLSQEAGRLCATPAFQDFLLHWHVTRGAFMVAHNELLMSAQEAATSVVRERCDVKSRADIDHDLNAAQSWKELTDAYYASQRGQDLDQQQEQLEAGRR